MSWSAWVFLALTLYRLLKHVHQGAASAMVVLVAIGAGIVSINTVFVFEGMRVATDSSYAAALGTGGANALVFMLLDTQRYGGLVSSVFMGLWLAPLGFLAYKSGMFPKALGVATHHSLRLLPRETARGLPGSRFVDSNPWLREHSDVGL